jgi:hypothetical protein
MSFGALAGWQAWLALLATAGLFTYLFFIKIRAPRVAVPSLMLWQRVLDATREMTLWERIRRIVSWIVITLIGVMLVLAVMRPAPSVTAAGGGRRLIILDSSWSMGAETSSGETRWERAIAEARALIQSSAGDEVAVATTADGLVEGPTTDAVLLEAALDRLVPSGGENSDWPRLSNVSKVHFITDGTLARPMTDLESTGADVVVQSVYESAPNVAITAFEVHEPGDPEAQAEAYLELANYSPQKQTAQLTVTRGTTTVGDVAVELAPGEAVRQMVPLGLTGDARVRARISAPDNALAVDDEAVAWIARAETLAVTVVSAEPGFLKVLFDRLPGMRATYIAPGAYDQPRTGAEHVIVFDHWVPPAAPTKPALYVSPMLVDGPAWIGQARIETKPQWATADRHAVLRGVDPATVTLERARSVESDAWTPVARSATGVPLVSVRETTDTRAVVLGFGLLEAESNVALQPAFPVLVVNAIEWLARPTLAGQLRPGVVPIEAAVTRVINTGGEAMPITAFGDTQLVRFPAPGLYLAEGGGMRTTFAVNVGDPQVSNVSRTSLSAEAQAQSAAARAEDPWWPWIVGIAFLLVLVEWWTWHRRITV